MVPVMATQKEIDEMIDKILDGDDPGSISSSEKVNDTPDQFKEWLANNKHRIDAAAERGTLPYFIKDNPSLINPKAKTTRDIAKERHSARTPDQIKDIKSRWFEERAIFKYGDSMLSLMGGIDDVDTTALLRACKTADLKGIISEGAKLKTIGKEIYAMDLLDDPMSVAKQIGRAHV